VLLAIDAPAHAIGIALEPEALGGRHDAVRSRDSLVAVKADFTMNQASRFGARQLSRPDALRDAFALIAFAGIEPGRVRKSGHCDGGQKDCEGKFPEHIESPLPIAHDLGRSVKGTAERDPG
jgi:hypothetical protein